MPAIKVALPFEVTSPSTQAFSLGMPAPGSLVFRPGGTRAGNVYTTETLLLQALATMPGVTTIAIDTSAIGGSYTVTQDWPLTEGQSIVGLYDDVDLVTPLLVFANGTTIGGGLLTELAISEVEIHVTQATPAVFANDNGNGGILALSGALTQIGSAAAGALFADGAIGGLEVVMHGGAVLQGLGAPTVGNCTILAYDAAVVNAGAMTPGGGVNGVELFSGAATVADAYSPVLFIGQGVTYVLNAADPTVLSWATQQPGALLVDSLGHRWTFETVANNWQGLDPHISFVPGIGQDGATVFGDVLHAAKYLHDQPGIKQCDVVLDGVGDTFTMPAGAIAWGSNVNLQGAIDLATNAFVTLVFAAGTTMTGLIGIGDVFGSVTQVGTDVITSPGGAAGGVLRTWGFAGFSSGAGAGKFLNSTAGVVDLYTGGESFLSTAGAVTMDASGAGTLQIFPLDLSSIFAGALDDTHAANVTINYDVSSASVDHSYAPLVVVNGGAAWATDIANPNGIVRAGTLGAKVLSTNAAVAQCEWTQNTGAGNTGWTLTVPEFVATISFNLAALQALGAGTTATLTMITFTANTTASLPEIDTTAFTGPGLASGTATMQGGADAAGSLVSNGNPLVTGAWGSGSNPYPRRGAQTISVKLTLVGITGGFAGLTAGALSARLQYQPQAA
jgi:hypothetical protein